MRKAGVVSTDVKGEDNEFHYLKYTDLSIGKCRLKLIK